MSKLICTDKCEKCKYGSVQDKHHLHILCHKRKKVYVYGQYLPCEDYLKGR